MWGKSMVLGLLLIGCSDPAMQECPDHDPLTPVESQELPFDKVLRITPEAADAMFYSAGRIQENLGILVHWEIDSTPGFCETSADAPCLRFTHPGESIGESGHAAGVHNNGWIRIDPDRARAHTVEHEILHWLGADHEDGDSCAVMYGEGSGRTYTQELVEAVCSVWACELPAS